MDGDDLWLYNARLGRSLRLPPSGRTGAFLGSDVSYNDIVGRDLERDYVAAFAEESASEGLIVLELTPRPGAPTPYGRVLIGVEAERLAPRWVDYYDQRGQVVKRLTLSEYLEAGRPVRAPAHGGGGPDPARLPDRGPPLRRGAGRRRAGELLYPAGPGKRVPVNVGPGLAQRLAA